MLSSMSLGAAEIAQRTGIRHLARWAIWYLKLALQVRRERQMLAALDDAQLTDIGLTRIEADVEASRDFLDVPYNRRSRLYL